MKNILKTFGGALMVALAFTACSPDDFTGADPNGLPDIQNYADAFNVYVDQNTNQAHFEFPDSVQGVTPVWLINGTRYSSNYSDSAYYRKAGDYTVECFVKNRNGISIASVTKEFHVNKTKMNGFAGFVADGPYNMWTQVDASVHTPTFYYAPGWAQIADPTYSMDKYDYVGLSLPQATTDQWQAQMFIPAGVATEASKTYDFSCIFTSNTSFKGNVTVQLGDANGNTFFTDKISLEAGEPVCFWKSDMPGIDIAADQLRIVLDFGGNAENTTVSIESIVLKDHANDDGTVVPQIVEDPTVYTYNSPNNIWKAVDDNFDAAMMTYYLADNNWATIGEPTLEALGGGQYKVTFPVASGSSQWQNQVIFHGDKLAALPEGALAVAANTKYDIRVKLNSTEAIPGVTVKVTDAGDDNNFFTADRHDILAGNNEIKIPAVSLEKDAANLSFVFDFAGAPAGTEVTISDMTIQKTKE